MPNFLSSLIDPVSGLNTLEMDSGCSVLSFTDQGNYDTNTQAGHARANFSNYRRAVITTGDGSTYIMSSVAAADVDETIPTASTGTDLINFTLRDSDIDGVYTVRLCNYPTWDNTLQYPAGEIVFSTKTNELFVANTLTPITTPPDQASEWDLYEPVGDDELLTPYCTEQKIAVLCRNILECKEKLVHEAFCLVDSDFCNDDILCKNKKFLDSVKMLVLISAMNDSVNRQAWNEVESQMNLLKTICSCK